MRPLDNSPVQTHARIAYTHTHTHTHMPVPPTSLLHLLIFSESGWCAWGENYSKLVSCACGYVHPPQAWSLKALASLNPKAFNHPSPGLLKNAQHCSLLEKCKSKLQWSYSSTSIIRMAIVKKSTNSKRWGGFGERGSLLQGWWECKLIQPLWRTVWRVL